MNETNNNTNMESEENLNDNTGIYNNGSSVYSNNNSAGELEGIAEENMDSPDFGGIDVDYVITDSIEETGNIETSPDAENTAISDGNGSHMESAPSVISDVSGGNHDAYLPPVSAGDIYNEYYNDFYLSCSCGDGMASPFTEDDVLHINGTLDALLFTTSGILFFIIFAWAEKKLFNAIKKLFRSSKPNL